MDNHIVDRRIRRSRTVTEIPQEGSVLAPPDPVFGGIAPGSPSLTRLDEEIAVAQRRAATRESGRIAAAAGIDVYHGLYSGDISHQRNRAFVNLLDIDLKPFEAAAVENRPTGSLLAFVDHA